MPTRRAKKQAKDDSFAIADHLIALAEQRQNADATPVVVTLRDYLVASARLLAAVGYAEPALELCESALRDGLADLTAALEGLPPEKRAIAERNLAKRRGNVH